MNVRWSNDPSGNGSSSADPSTSSTRPPNRARACASIPGLWSRPVTRKPRPRSRSATRPVPVATSRTCPPSRGSRSTMKRRQRGSCPNERSAPIRSYRGPRGANSSCACRARVCSADIALSWHGGPGGRARADRGVGRGHGGRPPTGRGAPCRAIGGRAAICLRLRGRRRCQGMARARRRRTGRPGTTRRPRRRLDRGALRGRRGGGVPGRPRRAPRRSSWPSA